MKTFLKFFRFVALMLIGIFELAIHLTAQGHSFVSYAVTQNPLIGRMKKGIGNLIAYTSYGQNIVRSKPLEINDANSTGQQAQRGVFSQAQLICRKLLNVIKIGFVNYTTNMSAYAYAIGQNMLLAKNAQTPPDGIDLTKLVVSKGNLLGYLNVTFTEQAGKNVQVDWENNSGFENALATDDSMFCALKADMSISLSDISTKVKRSVGSTTLSFDGFSAGDTVYIYGFFVSADGTLVSNNFVSPLQTLLA